MPALPQQEPRAQLQVEPLGPELQAQLKPYMLRRMKESVEKSIPAKDETIVDIELTTLQKQYYRAIYEQQWYRPITRNMTLALMGMLAVAGGFLLVAAGRRASRTA